MTRRGFFASMMTVPLAFFSKRLPLPPDGKDVIQIRDDRGVLVARVGQDGVWRTVSDEEVILRLSRIMRTAGPESCQIAFHRAFPRSKKTVSSAPRIEQEQEKLWRLTDGS